MEGSVKFFNRKKGFGFIAGDDGNEYFVHFTALPKRTFLRDNDRVSFDPAEGERGPKAENVKLLKMASDIAKESGEAPAEDSEEAPVEDDASEEQSEDDFEQEESEEPTDDEEKEE